MDRETLARLAPRCSLAVNCTSLGMEGTGGQFEDLSFVDALPPEAGVFDLIYSPAETALLRRARARGLRTANGLGMLIGRPSWPWSCSWTGSWTDPPWPVCWRRR